MPTGTPIDAEDDVARPDDTGTDNAGFSESNSTGEFGPFTGYSAACGFPDPLDASPSNVRTALRQIIEKDGPLTRDSVYRLYVEGCPDRRRASKAARQVLNRALGSMLRSGEIVQEDELGDGSLAVLVVRLAGIQKVRERPAGRRDLLDIPPSELLMVLDRLCRKTPGSPDDETLCRLLLDHYGFNRLTDVRRRYLARIVEVYHLRQENAGSGTDAKNNNL